MNCQHFIGFFVYTFISKNRPRRISPPKSRPTPTDPDRPGPTPTDPEKVDFFGFFQKGSRGIVKGNRGIVKGMRGIVKGNRGIVKGMRGIAFVKGCDPLTFSYC